MTVFKASPFPACWAAAAVALTAPAAYAQQQTFTGTWVVAPPAASVEAPAPPPVPVTLIISQTPTMLTVERREGAGSRAVNYRLDGGETVTTQKEDTATGQLKREGGKLMTETVYAMRGFPLTQTQVFSLSGDGRELTVESTMKVEHGYQTQSAEAKEGSPNASSGTDVYRRQ